MSDSATRPWSKPAKDKLVQCLPAPIGRGLIAWGLVALRSEGGAADDCRGGEGLGPHDRTGGVVSGRSPRAMTPLGYLEAN